MLNVNYGRNKALLQRCRPLSDYSLLTTSVREFKKRNKVAEMFLYEYDEKGVMEALKEEAKAEGKAEGKAEKAIEVAKAMLADGVPIEKVSQYSSIPIAELKKL